MICDIGQKVDHRKEFINTRRRIGFINWLVRVCLNDIITEQTPEEIRELAKCLSEGTSC